jgi:hypothetical protein
VGTIAPGHRPAFTHRRSGCMAKLRNEFSKKEWKHCCGNGCKKCAIHNAYLDAYGKKEGEKKFAKDHDRMH